MIKIVESKVRELEDVQDCHEVVCCGSYRRGRKECGDIDILIARKDHLPYGNFLLRLINSLEESGFLKERLLVSTSDSNDRMTYMGICKSDSLVRRIDIKIYPRSDFGFALLYFTGSDHFNRSMRLYARKAGFSLSDHGIAYSKQIKSSESIKGPYLKCETEEEIFQLFGMEYKEPHERDI